MLDGVILKCNYVAVPQTMQKQVLTLIHEGHMGITKCRLQACSFVYWLRLNSQNQMDDC